MNAREEWLQQRKAGLGGSDIGAILGLSQYRTPVDVWMDKTGRAPASEETLPMRFGTYAEEFVAQEYTRKTGFKVQRFNTMLRHPSAPLIGNLDRLVIPEGQKIAALKGHIRTDCLLECKTASAFSAFKDEEWGEEGTDKVPMSYLLQVAVYRILSGCHYADLAVLFGNQELRVYHLWSDAELEEMIVAKATEWWNAHIVADVAPEPVCEADIKRLYPSDNGESIEATAADIVLIETAKQLKEQIAALEAQLDGDKKAGTLGTIGMLKARMGEASRLTFGGDDLITWKSAKGSQKTDYAKALIEFGAALGIPATDERLQAAIRNNTFTTTGARRFLIKE